MSNFELVFDGKAFRLPRKAVFELVSHRRELLDADRYAVQSAVPADVFAIFLHALNTQEKVPVTRDNAIPLSLLAKEFFLPDLASECAKCTAEPHSDLSTRVSRLERQISWVLGRKEVEERLDSQERRVVSLEQQIDALRTSSELQLHKGETLHKAIEQSTEPPRRSAGHSARRPPPVSSPGGPTPLEFPLKMEDSLDGIIAYLTRNHGGNVHEKGIVTLTSGVVAHHSDWGLKNVVDLRTESAFESKGGDDDWVCWDFGKRRIRLTHYTIYRAYLRSWVLETSLDGTTWTLIHSGLTEESLVESRLVSSFAASSPNDARFVRVRKTAKDTWDLELHAVEFFGTLTE